MGVIEETALGNGSGRPAEPPKLKRGEAGTRVVPQD